MEGGGGGGAVSEKPEGGASYTYWVREVREDAAPLPLPRKLTPGDILNSQPATLGSVWNSAGTWEEKNLNKWATDRIKELLVSVGFLEFPGGKAQISDVSKCVGDAFLVTVRNKKRVGYTYELTLKVKGEWTIKEEKKMVKGHIDIPEFSFGELDDLQEISEAPQISPITIVDLQENKSNYPLVVQMNGQGNSTHRLAEAAAAHKPRIRWTSELHEIFLDTVDKLGGPENATPKGILKLMNVEGLNYYHVKSHLQKYRLAKNVPELKHDKRASISEEKKLASTNNDDAEYMTRGMSVTEALRLQIEIQKQLHEQLKVQNSLQLLLVQHREDLRLRMLSEEQEQAGSALIPATASP